MVFFASFLGGVIAARYATPLPEERGRRWVALSLPVGLFVTSIITAPRGYLLTKSIGMLIMPMGLTWLALLTLALIAFWRRRPRAVALSATAWLLVTLVGSEALADAVTAYVEGPHAWISAADEGPFDAVIVLGGGTDQTPLDMVQLGRSGDRVVLGARLYHRGLTPKLVASGSPIEGFASHDSVAATSQIWQELGVPRDAIVRVEGARTTSEEAEHHARVIREQGWRRVGLVTSARHMARAVANFRAQGVRVIPLPAAIASRRVMRWRGFYSLIPQGRAADDLHASVWELVGRAAGR